MDPPRIDGRLDEAVWATAVPATGFVQLEPQPGTAASERTEARVVYDGEALYVGMRMYDSAPDSVRAQFARRDDADAQSDWAHVFIDSYHDRRTAFHFATTPRGIQVDILHLQDDVEDRNWDAVWEVAATTDTEGWSAEFRIPLSQLRFKGGDEATWGINFMRQVSRRAETSYWAPIPPNAGRLVSLFGELQGLRDLRAPDRFEILPYTVGRLTRAPGEEANPYYSPNDVTGSAGADVKYGLTSDLTLTATLNPDFGQVEADPSVVNLSAFETFFPEKRPFFTEGAEIFRFAIVPEGHVFYSRRIGRPPQGRARVPGGYVDAPETARILAAAKLSGKTRSGWSVGVLNAVTGTAEARLADTLGFEWTQPVEPLTNYAVARVLRDFRRGASGLGVIATALHRDIEAGGPLDFLRSSAYAVGTNGWHRFGGSRYQLSGWLLGTHIRGGADAIATAQRSFVHFFQRPDAEHLTYDPERTALSGWAGEAFLSKIGGGHWTWSLGGGARSPGADVNDMGFISYTDTWYGTGILAYRQFEPGPVFRNWSAQFQAVSAFTFGLEPLRPSGHLDLNAQLRNFWRLSLGVDRYNPRLWPWELRGGPALRLLGYTSYTASVQTDTRNSWQLRLNASRRLDDDGLGHSTSLRPVLELRPSARASVSLAPSITWNRDPDQYVAQASVAGGREYITGLLEQTTASLTMRLGYAFNADLSLDVYAQPFVSDGRYALFRTVADPRARAFDNRFDTIGDAALSYDASAARWAVDRDGDGTPEFDFRDPDFSVREFQSNAVLRWEYRPGSTLYVVWSQSRGDNVRLDDFALGRDLDRLFSAQATNVFIMKLSYWLGS